MIPSIIKRPSADSSAFRANAIISFPMASCPALIPRLRREGLRSALVQGRQQGSTMKSKSRFIRRTGTAATMEQDAQSGCMGNASSRRRFSCSALKLASAFGRLLLGMMDRAGRLGANLAKFALVDAVETMASVVYLHVLNSGQFAFSGVLGLSGRISTYLFRGMVLLAFRLLLVGRADLDKLRFGGNLGLNVRVELRGIAGRVGASVHCRYVGKQELVVSGALGAFDAASGGGNKLRVAFVERRLFQDEQDVLLNPVLEMANGKQDALGLASGSVPLLAEAIGEGLFLLGGLQFGESKACPTPISSA